MNYIEQQSTMFKLAMPGGSILCKPENIGKYNAALEKASKRKLWKAKAEKRIFPSTMYCGSTREYVAAYVRLNSIAGLGDPAEVDKHWILSTTPTIWPDPSLDTVDQED